MTTGTLWLDLFSMAIAIGIAIGLFISVERNS